MTEDITFCGYHQCPNRQCERHSSHMKNTEIIHSFALFTSCEYLKSEEENSQAVKRNIDE